MRSGGRGRRITYFVMINLTQGQVEDYRYLQAHFLCRKLKHWILRIGIFGALDYDHMISTPNHTNETHGRRDGWESSSLIENKILPTSKCS